ncbi:YbdK family carboxylate-amine ligase [Solihabitans fulvus]|uniref:Putative glutamate--cysteine ligase 2 n=1 Tax=Solihabitans fulvus TaxID=1892852 RepID=A0A5B2XF42_9PSEU|nr:glutamate--cysteine ligase [Solihabitans fulvus]KAA2261689.1 YbdK family carboxylate-amine ligase [Solihabitans fulvus]
MSEAEVANVGRPLPQPRPSSDDQLSIGVEEEFLLVDPDTRNITPVAPSVLAAAGERIFGLQPEITTFQVETATPVCRTMSELREHLVLSRRTLAGVAGEQGARLVASGTPVLGRVRPAPLTPNPRYERMAEVYGTLAGGMIICGCHVHIGVPDDDTGVRISNHLRAWLPTLLAISVNSPFWGEHDTGYASWRYLVWARWPSAGPPPWFDSAEDYHAALGSLLDSGAAMDRGMLYWDVRLSANHPTVELRVCDVAGTVDEAVLIAALGRAIAGMALFGTEAAAAPPPHVLRAALWRSAKDGLEGAGVDPRTGKLVPAAALVKHLMTWARPALEASGDFELVSSSVDRMLMDGSAAQRQRNAFRTRGRLSDVVDLLTAQTAGE